MTTTATTGKCPTRYLKQLEQEALRHRALHHPWLQAIGGARIPDMRQAFCDFAETYQGYSAWFPRYLSAVMDRLEDPRHRALLAENLEEESGSLHDEDKEILLSLGIELEWIDGVSHPRLFRRFREAIGGDPRTLPEATAQWRMAFLSYLRSPNTPIAAAVGALGLGTEGVVKHIYRPIRDGLAQTPGISRRDAVFFELHCTVDDQHQQDLLEVAAELASTPEDRRHLRTGMLHALDLRARFWDRLWAQCSLTNNHPRIRTQEGAVA